MQAKILEYFKENPKASTYEAAKALNVTEYEVLKTKGADEFKLIDASHYKEVFEALKDFGPVLFCKSTPEFIIEIKLEIAAASEARGYYNFKSDLGFLGGHLNPQSIGGIGFVSTVFMGMLGHSIHFYNTQNEVIFKLFMSRGEKHQLDEAQVKKFMDLKARF